MATPGSTHRSYCNRRIRTHRWKWTLALASIGFVSAGSPPVCAQAWPDEDPSWQVSVGADSASALTDSFFDSYQAHGFELGLAYRVSPRFGAGLVAIQHRIREEFEFSVFDATLSTEFRYEPTWLLARADFHLTPGRRVDFVISPLAGMVSTSDVELRNEFRFPGEPPESTTVRFGSRDGFAWGLRLALDIPLGRVPGRSSLTTGLTFLGAEEDDNFGGEPGEEIGIQYELVSFHVGYAYRF